MSLFDNIFSKKNKKNRKDLLKGEIDIKQIREDAENYYRKREYYCSEAVVKVIHENFENTYGSDIVKLASGFPVGIGGAMCTCGAVNGGVIAIGMFFGRELGKDKQVNKTMELSRELYNEFTKKHKVACCKILTKGKKIGSSQHLSHCVEMTGELAEITARILARELGYKIKVI